MINHLRRNRNPNPKPYTHFRRNRRIYICKSSENTNGSGKYQFWTYLFNTLVRIGVAVYKEGGLVLLRSTTVKEK